MLKKFEVRNFKGFKENIVFDLSAREYSFNSKLVKNGLINKGIIYGKNGTGKSNLGIALFDIVATLTDKQRLHPDYTANYINYETSEMAAVFKYEFLFDNDIVRYEYAKSDIDSLIFENFYVNDKPLFEYDFFNKNRIYISDDIKKHLNFNSIIDNRLSIAKFISRGTPTNTVPHVQKLIDFVEGMLWYRSLSEGNNYAGFSNGISLLSEVLYESGKIKEFQEFLEENELHYNLKFRSENGQHQLYACYDNGEAPFNTIASTGTNALFLFYTWSLSFNKISLLFVDELDAFFHYESAAGIINRLNNNDSFQSIVTSHNTYLMQNKLTRPDACFIISNNKIKPLCNCTDKEIREAHNLEKMYVNGAFNE